MSGNPDSELLSGQNEYKYHFVHRQLPGSIARESQNRYGQVLSGVLHCALSVVLKVNILSTRSIPTWLNLRANKQSELISSS